MGARGRAGNRSAPRRGRGRFHQYLQSRGRRDLWRRHAGRRQAVQSAAQRSQATRVQAGLGSLQDRAGHASRHRRRIRGGRGVPSKALGTPLKRLGVIGSMVWDTIHGRDPAQAAVEEWGGISYALAALYVNFISGFEMNLETAQLLRRGFPRFMYADLHSLFLGKQADGMRVPRALPQAPAWFGCFDVIQLNEDEMSQLGSDPLAIAADALRQGCRTLCVTLGGRGAAYFTGEPIRTARIPAPAIHPPAFAQENDPTGCGDVFGGTVAAALVGGASLEEALRAGTQLGTRNLSHRGATGLRDHL